MDRVKRLSAYVLACTLTTHGYAMSAENRSGAHVQNLSDAASEDLLAQLRESERLVEAGEFPSAEASYLQLWGSWREYPMVVSDPPLLIARGMGKLAQNSAESKAKFAELRDEVEKRLKDKDSDSDRALWILLSAMVLDDDEPVLQWIESQCSTVSGRKKVQKFLIHRERLLEDLLVEHSEWITFGNLVDNHRERMDRIEFQMHRDLYRDRSLEGRQAMHRELEEVIGRQAIALIAVDRIDDAFEIIEWGMIGFVNRNPTATFQAIWKTQPETRTMVEEKLAGRAGIPEVLRFTLR